MSAITQAKPTAVKPPAKRSEDLPRGNPRCAAQASALRALRGAHHVAKATKFARIPGERGVSPWFLPWSRRHAQAEQQLHARAVLRDRQRGRTTNGRDRSPRPRVTNH
jgi:hypothetical protein